MRPTDFCFPTHRQRALAPRSFPTDVTELALRRCGDPGGFTTPGSLRRIIREHGGRSRPRLRGRNLRPRHTSISIEPLTSLSPASFVRRSRAHTIRRWPRPVPPQPRERLRLSRSEMPSLVRLALSAPSGLVSEKRGPTRPFADLVTLPPRSGSRHLFANSLRDARAACARPLRGETRRDEHRH